MTTLPLPVLLAAGAVGVSLPVLWWALAGARRPRRVAAPGKDLRQAVLARSAGERVGRPLARAAAARARRLTPAGVVASLERRVVFAGRPPEWPLERVLTAKLVLGGAGTALGALIAVKDPRPGLLLVGCLAAALGYFAPDVVLSGRARERQQAIQRELPDTLDQMTIAVEAGLGFESAMARAARSGTGPLAQEMGRTLQELQFGIPRVRAFRNLAERSDVSDLRHFVIAIVQAESYGVPIADVLRTQAAEQRIKRRQRAEETAMKIPVKVIFPLILCILPTLFIVLIGPAVIRIARTLGGG